MNKSILLATTAAFALAAGLSGCANDGTYYRADTYSAGQVNRVQEVNTVEIISVGAARVAVSNEDNRQNAQIAGVAIGNHNHHTTDSRVLGGVGGAALGGLAGSAVGGDSTTYTDGVQIIFRNARGKVLQTSQVGRPCEFRTGTAIMVSPTPNEARIQPNNPYGCGQSK